jgi:hypothetical protein
MLLLRDRRRQVPGRAVRPGDARPHRRQEVPLHGLREGVLIPPFARGYADAWAGRDRRGDGNRYAAGYSEGFSDRLRADAPFRRRVDEAKAGAAGGRPRL